MMDPLIGQDVEGYRIEEVLGHGGMGIVYQAEDVALSRTVALKMIDPALARDEAFLRRFRAEARALARISSPHIVSVHALRQTRRGLFIVMEYVDGHTLADRLNGGPVPWREALPFIRQMLTALAHAHSVGVIHRDIKPSNIMLTHTGQVKVADFGLAKVRQAGQTAATRTQGVAGTLHYMSPEQVKGSATLDHRTDLYSMGMTLYEMLAGELPLDREASEFAIMRAIVEDEPPPPTKFVAGLPPRLVQVVMTSLEKDPADRYPDAEATRAALDGLETQRVAEGPTRIVERSPARRKATLPRVARMGGIALVVVALLALGAYTIYPQLASWLGGGRRSPPAAARLSISTTPAGAAVYLDDDSVGTTPLARYAYPVSGDGDEVRLRLVREGYAPVHRILRLQAGQPLSLENLTLNRLSTADSEVEAEEPATPDLSTSSPEPSDEEPIAQASLTLGVEPAGSVTIGGETYQQRGVFTLAPGRYTVTFRHPTYGTFEETLPLRAGQSLQLTYFFMHELNVNVTNADGSYNWASVWVNGERAGVTPFSETVGPGEYRVMVQRTGYETLGEPKTVTVTPAFEQQAHRLSFQIREQPYY